ncbi:hypothetical protein F4860DRAFT_455073 [Xylaria cubensis]|nr:hypothetical protein F4860DRAFT_455073 [Xylaria cubensis]
MPLIHQEEPAPSGGHSPSQEPDSYEESTPPEEQAPRENPNQSEEPKPYRLYVVLYDLGVIFHWAFVIRDSKGTFLLDATIGDDERKYRNRN